MNYSDSTTVNRRHAIRWCDERGLELELKQPQDITKPILECYKRHLYHYRKTAGKTLSFRTQAGRIQGIKAFLNG